MPDATGFKGWCGLFLVLALGLGWLSLASCDAANAALDTHLVLTQVPRQKNPKPADARQQRVARDWAEGSRLVVLSPEGKLRVLSEGFAAAGDASVSFDGKTILFAGKQEPDSRWRVYEIGADGQGLRAVSPEHMEARSPLYVSTLFTLDSPQPWFTMLFVARDAETTEMGRPWTWNLYNLKLDGTELRRLTYNPNDSYDPVQMWDGRVIYSSERHPVEPGPGSGRVGLYAIHIEGADMELYGGERSVKDQHMACSLGLDRVVFIEPEPDSWDGAGQLAAVEERRPHVTYERLTEGSKQLYLFPAPYRDKRILVSRRPAGSNGNSGVFVFDLQSRKATPVFDSPEYDDVQARMLASHTRPDGHSTVVEQAATNGTLYGLNCYDAEPRLAAHLKTGAVKRVRLIEGIVQNAAPQAGCGPAPFVGRRLIGEAPVEADGSFNVVVPANAPLLLQTVDERGMALATCGWIWVKNKETRGCIGCHEDPERIPENDYVLALRRESNRLTPTPAQCRSITFVKDIAPIMNTHCATAECHGGKETPLHLPLSARASDADLQRAYDALTVPKGKKAERTQGKYIDAGRSRTSWLIWQLHGERTSRPWDLSAQPAGKTPKVKQMPPEGKGVPPLTAEQIQTIIQWVDLGAPFKNPGSPETATRNEQAQLR
jgi:hypothetical protein